MKPSIILSLLLLFAFSSCDNSASTPSEEEMPAFNRETEEILFVGTYTRKEGHVDGKAAGVYVLRMEKETGKLALVNIIRDVTNPSYLTIHPNKKWFYAVNEIADGNRIGMVSAYAFDEELNVSELNQVSSKGDAPCHISIDRTGKYVLVANYMETIAVLPIQEDGSLGEATSVVEHKRTKPAEVRQETGHPHKIEAVGKEGTIFVSDLGLDKVFHYNLDADGTLKEITKTATTFKSGPRHFDFHPNGEWVYVLNELNSSVELFQYNGSDLPFKPLQSIETLTENIKDNGPSAIHIHPSGQFLYTANRGLNGSKEQSISIFSIDAESGDLTLLGVESTKGDMPRDFAIDPSGRFLLAANQNSDNIITFKINAETGMLEDTGLEFQINTPVCLKFL